MLRLWAQNAQPSSIYNAIYPIYTRSLHASTPVLKSRTHDKPSPKSKSERPNKKDWTKDGPLSTLAVSKSISWLLRHGAAAEGLPIRADGYVPVDDLLQHRTLRGVDAKMLETIVKNDAKSRFNLSFEPRASKLPGPSSQPNVWWIRANQGHTLNDVKLDLQLITSASQVRMAVHGTTLEAWNLISKQGISRMGRHHIHLAQGVVGPGVISGMRSSSRVLIYVDLQKALDAGLKFYLSSNGVVLTPGNEPGVLEPQFFEKVERVGAGHGPGTLLVSGTDHDD